MKKSLRLIALVSSALAITLMDVDGKNPTRLLSNANEDTFDMEDDKTILLLSKSVSILRAVLPQGCPEICAFHRHSLSIEGDTRAQDHDKYERA